MPTRAVPRAGEIRVVGTSDEQDSVLSPVGLFRSAGFVIFAGLESNAPSRSPMFEGWGVSSACEARILTFPGE